MSDKMIRVRVSQDLHSAFLAACKQADSTASQVLRRYMRLFVDKAEVGSAQLELLADAGNGLQIVHREAGYDRKD